MKHKELSRDEHKITLLCVGSIENSSDLSFLDQFLPQAQEVLIDCEGIDYINSCGFGALVEAHLQFEQANKKLYFCNLDATIRKTIGYLGAEELLNLVD